jgi:TonB family protein
MKRVSRVVATLGVVAVVASAVPALAQYATEFVPAKVLKEGTTTHNIAGSGTVTVQVQVNPDGSHKVIRVIRSTNTGDNDAALEIAQTSSYKPATRGTTPTISFYDFVLKFNGKLIVKSAEEQAVSDVAGGADTASIDALIQKAKYKDAIAKAQAALAAAPGNQALLQLLGVAQFYDGDMAGAASTFAQVSNVKKPFAPLASQAFAQSAITLSQTNAEQSLADAQKAMALSNSVLSQFALGVAQMANKQAAQAVDSLKSAAAMAKDSKTKLNVDQELLQADLATGDTAGADAVATEMKTLDPNGAAPQHAIAQYHLRLGSDAMQASHFPAAVKEFDLAAAAGSPPDALTANTLAAFAILRMTKSDTPDYAKAKDYALKAVAAAPDDPNANFAVGIAYADIYNASQKKDDLTAALNYLKKSDELAKAAGNQSLAQQIEAQIKNLAQ